MTTVLASATPLPPPPSLTSSATWASRALTYYQRTVLENPLIGGRGETPHPKQQQFLLHTETRELFYGGAGGGGKSQSLWYGALQFIDVPGYAALILRRTFADLDKPGAIMDRSKSYLAGAEAEWNETKKRWRFPNGATITFGYLKNENDKYQYQSSEFQYIAFDELTQFTETQYSYLFTRLRKKSIGPVSTVPLRMRSASNPGGTGHQWVFDRFVNERTRKPGRIFIPARMTDNPSLDREEYERSLEETDALTREQIKSGDWNAIEGGRFKREWFPRYRTRGEYLLLQRPGEQRERTYHLWTLPLFITCDPNASAKTTADYTVAGVWAVTPELELVLLDADRFQAEIPDIVPRLMALWQKWRSKPGGVWIEEVAANNGVFKLACRTPMPARSLRPLGEDKLVRATTAINYAATGRIWLPVPGLVPGMPLDELEAEWYRFTGNARRDAHDDAVDMLSYAARVLGENPVAPGSRETAPHYLGGMMG